ncbi:MAG TPA: bacteriohopanetetrol glucosamine biosynthesis glycosyltransferase HpnI [Rhizomicrobium sp.]|jgi:ceramide glucosyltransferase|nr:bacteriohopanetetrol glucosamine biosynthesis glycosyltransferase HpnI [Rhizomicrobium sp.]
MQDWIAWTALIVTALAGCGTFYAICVLAVAALCPADARRSLVKFPPLTLLKPLHLDEPRLMHNLESFCRQDYPAPLQIVFGVQDPLDPAVRIVETLKRSHPALDIELVIDTRIYGANRKVSNLINLVERAKYDVLVLSDSDIEAGPGYLSTVAASLEHAGGGAVTCLYTGFALDNIWSRLAAMGINYQFIPNVLVGTALGLAAPCFGSTIALRKDLLRRIGGMQAFSNHLADDYEIGRAVRSHGYRMSLAPVVVAHTCAEQNWREMIQHELRWARTIRLLNPGGHWGTLVTHAVPLAVIGLALGGFSASGFAVLAAAFLARAGVKLRMDRVLGACAGPIWLLPARDVLSFCVYLGSLFGGGVRWRGSRFLVAPDGVLQNR